MNNRIIRSVCYFSKHVTSDTVEEVKALRQTFTNAGFEVQTIRICSPTNNPVEFEQSVNDKEILLSIGSIPFTAVKQQLPQFYKTHGVSFNIDLTTTSIDISHTTPLFDIIKNKPSQTFAFTYVFNNKPSSPYFPSASYEHDGFSVGLQPTDLSQRCTTLEQWLEKMKASWMKIYDLFKDDSDFLGIDASIAPIFSGKGSLINFIKRLGYSFTQSVITDIYLQITQFLKTNNPKPVGLCGLMMPCLEDFELADEYEQGNFSIERNLFLSLHSGLGIDTYPIGIDEKPERVVEILKLVQGLSNKYHKPLSARFVSDVKAKIGEKTDFQNQYLKDVVVKPI